MFRLAQVTDPHFRSLVGWRPWDLVGKRALGLANLILNRARKHRMDLLERLLDDLRGQAVDHLAVTGDLSNVALEGEFAAARSWLDRCGAPPARVTVIPGNHDIYVPSVARSGIFERMFAPFQDAAVRVDGQGYPFARLAGEVAVVGVNTCVPTRGPGAWGEIGGAQLGRLEKLLQEPEVRRRTRVILVHHPPVMLKGTEVRNLRDRDELASTLGRAGADLVIHGHDHRDERATMAGPQGSSIPVVGAGSASYVGSPERRARYNVYEIEGKTITMAVRSHDELSGAFREVRRERLAPAS